MLAALQTAKPLNRLDRHVLRANLRLASESSRFSVTFALEEALRLATLPGEEEGRIYVLNKISLRGLPAHADRRLWMDRVQSTLADVAATAVPGSHPSASTANAVYFHNLEHALETLLSMTLRCLPSTNAGTAVAPAWFVAAFLGLPTASYAIIQPATLFNALLDRLSPAAMPLPATASILLSAIAATGPIPLLDAIPEPTLRAWLSRIAPSSTSVTSTHEAVPVILPLTLQTMLHEAAASFGWSSPATLWLASLAIASAAPSTPSGELYRRARATLRQLDLSCKPPQSHTPATSSSRATVSVVAVPNSASTEEIAQKTSPPDFECSTAPEQKVQRTEASTTAAPAPSQTTNLLGEPTPSAGLFFLLHVLRHLGVATALKDSPALAEADLPAHILRTLALRSGVVPTDPIFLPLAIADSPFTLVEEALPHLAPTALPQILDSKSSRISTLSANDLLQMWTRAVRRWCVQHPRISVRRLIHRPGHLWLTRTDLDVTLPLTAIDVRIRRAGLDLDPLWLPWLGPTGRVVRFHYGNNPSRSGAD